MKLKIGIWLGILLVSQSVGAQTYNPFGGRSECTTSNGGNAGNGGATLITGVGMAAFCIENTVRSSAIQTTAVSTCSALGGNWGLCKQKEIVATCLYGYRSSTSNSLSQGIAAGGHWTVDLYNATNGITMGGSGCTYGTNAALASSYGYRCCLR